MNTIEWPICFNADTITDDDLGRAFDFCLTKEARALAAACAERARENILAIREEFFAAVRKANVRSS